MASFLIGFTTATLIRGFGARIVDHHRAAWPPARPSSASRCSTTTTWQLYAATTVQGVGSGLVFSSLAGVVVASVSPAEQTGVASGMNANIRTIGGSIGVSGDGRASSPRRPVPAATRPERGYIIGFVVLGVVMALASIAALRIPDTHEQPTGGHLADAADGELGLVPAAGAVPPRG